MFGFVEHSQNAVLNCSASELFSLFVRELQREAEADMRLTLVDPENLKLAASREPSSWESDPGFTLEIAISSLAELRSTVNLRLTTTTAWRYGGILKSSQRVDASFRQVAAEMLNVKLPLLIHEQQQRAHVVIPDVEDVISQPAPQPMEVVHPAYPTSLSPASAQQRTTHSPAATPRDNRKLFLLVLAAIPLWFLFRSLSSGVTNSDGVVLGSISSVQGGPGYKYVEATLTNRSNSERSVYVSCRFYWATSGFGPSEGSGTWTVREGESVRILVGTERTGSTASEVRCSTRSYSP